MSWNHRVILTNGHYAMHECYYEDGASIPNSWTTKPVAIEGETVHEIRTTLIWMTAALLLPVLEAYKDGDDDKLREVQ